MASIFFGLIIIEVINYMSYTSNTEFENKRVHYTNELPPYDLYEGVHSLLTDDIWQWLLGYNEVEFDVKNSDVEVMTAYDPDNKSYIHKSTNGTLSTKYGPAPIEKRKDYVTVFSADHGEFIQSTDDVEIAQKYVNDHLEEINSRPRKVIRSVEDVNSEEFLYYLEFSSNQYAKFIYYDNAVINLGIQVTYDEYHAMDLHGVLMPEEDLFLHEIYRYLETLYPDSPDWVDLLTRNEVNDAITNAAALVDYRPDNKFFELVAASLGDNEYDTVREAFKIKLRNLTNNSYRRKLYGTRYGYRMFGNDIFKNLLIFPLGTYLPLDPVTLRMLAWDIDSGKWKVFNQNRVDDIDLSNVSITYPSQTLKNRFIDQFDKNYQKKFRLIDWTGSTYTPAPIVADEDDIIIPSTVIFNNSDATHNIITFNDKEARRFFKNLTVGDVVSGGGLPDTGEPTYITEIMANQVRVSQDFICEGTFDLHFKCQLRALNRDLSNDLDNYESRLLEAGTFESYNPYNHGLNTIVSSVPATIKDENGIITHRYTRNEVNLENCHLNGISDIHYFKIDCNLDAFCHDLVPYYYEDKYKEIGVQVVNTVTGNSVAYEKAIDTLDSSEMNQSIFNTVLSDLPVYILDHIEVENAMRNPDSGNWEECVPVYSRVTYAQFELNKDRIFYLRGEDGIYQPINAERDPVTFDIVVYDTERPEITGNTYVPGKTVNAVMDEYGRYSMLVEYHVDNSGFLQYLGYKKAKEKGNIIYNYDYVESYEYAYNFDHTKTHYIKQRDNYIKQYDSTISEYAFEQMSHYALSMNKSIYVIGTDVLYSKIEINYKTDLDINTTYYEYDSEKDLYLPVDINDVRLWQETKGNGSYFIFIECESLTVSNPIVYERYVQNDSYLFRAKTVTPERCLVYSSLIKNYYIGDTAVSTITRYNSEYISDSMFGNMVAANTPLYTIEKTKKFIDVSNGGTDYAPYKADGTYYTYDSHDSKIQKVYGNILTPSTIKFNNDIFVDISLNKKCYIDGEENLVKVDWIDYLADNASILSRASDNVSFGAHLLLNADITEGNVTKDIATDAETIMLGWKSEITESHNYSKTEITGLTGQDSGDIKILNKVQTPLGHYTIVYDPFSTGNIIELYYEGRLVYMGMSLQFEAYGFKSTLQADSARTIEFDIVNTARFRHIDADKSTIPYYALLGDGYAGEDITEVTNIKHSIAYMPLGEYDIKVNDNSVEISAIQLNFYKQSFKNIVKNYDNGEIKAVSDRLDNIDIINNNHEYQVTVDGANISKYNTNAIWRQIVIDELSFENEIEGIQIAGLNNKVDLSEIFNNNEKDDVSEAFNYSYMGEWVLKSENGTLSLPSGEILIQMRKDYDFGTIDYFIIRDTADIGSLSLDFSNYSVDNDAAVIVNYNSGNKAFKYDKYVRGPAIMMLTKSGPDFYWSIREMQNNATSSFKIDLKEQLIDVCKNLLDTSRLPATAYFDENSNTAVVDDNGITYYVSKENHSIGAAVEIALGQIQYPIVSFVELNNKFQVSNIISTIPQVTVVYKDTSDSVKTSLLQYEPADKRILPLRAKSLFSIEKADGTLAVTEEAIAAEINRRIEEYKAANMSAEYELLTTTDVVKLTVSVERPVKVNDIFIPVTKFEADKDYYFRLKKITFTGKSSFVSKARSLSTMLYRYLPNASKKFLELDTEVIDVSKEWSPNAIYFEYEKDPDKVKYYKVDIPDFTQDIYDEIQGYKNSSLFELVDFSNLNNMNIYDISGLFNGVYTHQERIVNRDFGIYLAVIPVIKISPDYTYTVSYDFVELDTNKLFTQQIRFKDLDDTSSHNIIYDEMVNTYETVLPLPRKFIAEGSYKFDFVIDPKFYSSVYDYNTYIRYLKGENNLTLASLPIKDAIITSSAIFYNEDYDFFYTKEQMLNTDYADTNDQYVIGNDYQNGGEYGELSWDTSFMDNWEDGSVPKEFKTISFDPLPLDFYMELDNSAYTTNPAYMGADNYIDSYFKVADGIFTDLNFIDAKSKPVVASVQFAKATIEEDTVDTLYIPTAGAEFLSNIDEDSNTVKEVRNVIKFNENTFYKNVKYITCSYQLVKGQADSSAELTLTPTLSKAAGVAFDSDALTISDRILKVSAIQLRSIYNRLLDPTLFNNYYDFNARVSSFNVGGDGVTTMDLSFDISSIDWPENRIDLSNEFLTARSRSDFMATIQGLLPVKNSQAYNKSSSIMLPLEWDSEHFDNPVVKKIEAFSTPSVSSDDSISFRYFKNLIVVEGKVSAVSPSMIELTLVGSGAAPLIRSGDQIRSIVPLTSGSSTYTVVCKLVDETNSNLINASYVYAKEGLIIVAAGLDIYVTEARLTGATEIKLKPVGNLDRYSRGFVEKIIYDENKYYFVVSVDGRQSLRYIEADDIKSTFTSTTVHYIEAPLTTGSSSAVINIIENPSTAVVDDQPVTVGNPVLLKTKDILVEDNEKTGYYESLDRQFMYYDEVEFDQDCVTADFVLMTKSDDGYVARVVDNKLYVKSPTAKVSDADSYTGEVTGSKHWKKASLPDYVNTFRQSFYEMNDASFYQNIQILYNTVLNDATNLGADSWDDYRTAVCEIVRDNFAEDGTFEQHDDYSVSFTLKTEEEFTANDSITVTGYSINQDEEITGIGSDKTATYTFSSKNQAKFAYRKILIDFVEYAFGIRQQESLFSTASVENVYFEGNDIYIETSDYRTLYIPEHKLTKVEDIENADNWTAVSYSKELCSSIPGVVSQTEDFKVSFNGTTLTYSTPAGVENKKFFNIVSRYKDEYIDIQVGYLYPAYDVYNYFSNIQSAISSYRSEEAVLSRFGESSVGPYDFVETSKINRYKYATPFIAIKDTDGSYRQLRLPEMASDLGTNSAYDSCMFTGVQKIGEDLYCFTTFGNDSINNPLLFKALKFVKGSDGWATEPTDLQWAYPDFGSISNDLADNYSPDKYNTYTDWKSLYNTFASASDKENGISYASAYSLSVRTRTISQPGNHLGIPGFDRIVYNTMTPITVSSTEEIMSVSMSGTAKLNLSHPIIPAGNSDSYRLLLAIYTDAQVSDPTEFISYSDRNSYVDDNGKLLVPSTVEVGNTSLADRMYNNKELNRDLPSFDSNGQPIPTSTGLYPSTTEDVNHLYYIWSETADDTYVAEPFENKDGNIIRLCDEEGNLMMGGFENSSPVSRFVNFMDMVTYHLRESDAIMAPKPKYSSWKEACRAEATRIPDTEFSGILHSARRMVVSELILDQAKPVIRVLVSGITGPISNSLVERLNNGEVVVSVKVSVPYNYYDGQYHVVNQPVSYTSRNKGLSYFIKQSTYVDCSIASITEKMDGNPEVEWTTRFANVLSAGKTAYQVKLGETTYTSIGNTTASHLFKVNATAVTVADIADDSTIYTKDDNNNWVVVKDKRKYNEIINAACLYMINSIPVYETPTDNTKMFVYSKLLNAYMGVERFVSNNNICRLIITPVADANKVEATTKEVYALIDGAYVKMMDYEDLSVEERFKYINDYNNRHTVCTLDIQTVTEEDSQSDKTLFYSPESLLKGVKTLYPILKQINSYTEVFDFDEEQNYYFYNKEGLTEETKYIPVRISADDFIEHIYTANDIGDNPVTGIYMPVNGYGGTRNQSKEWSGSYLPWDVDPDAFYDEYLQNSEGDPIYLCDKEGNYIQASAERGGGFIQVKTPKYFGLQQLVSELGYEIEGSCVGGGSIGKVEYRSDSLVDIKDIDTVITLKNRIPDLSKTKSGSSETVEKINDGEIHYIKIAMLTKLPVVLSPDVMNNKNYFIKIDNKDIYNFGYDRVYWNPNGYPMSPIKIGNEIFKSENNDKYYSFNYKTNLGNNVYECNEDGYYVKYESTKHFDKYGYIYYTVSDPIVLGYDSKTKRVNGNLTEYVTADSDQRFRPLQPRYVTCQEWYKAEFYTKGDEKNPYWQDIQFTTDFDEKTMLYNSVVSIYDYKKVAATMSLVEASESSKYFNILSTSSVKNNVLIKNAFVDTVNGEIRFILTLNENNEYYLNGHADPRQADDTFVRYGISVFNPNKFSMTAIHSAYYNLFDIQSITDRSLIHAYLQATYDVNTYENYVDKNDRDKAIMKANELGIYDKDNNLLIYSHFPTIEYRTDTQHIDFTMVLRDSTDEQRL